ncbi:MAG: gliding motility lipoprotein GldH [Bacteroidetes bacterium]|nr:gliding motility lipoprotein GldH [Bacteroidota bacterium]
MKVNLNYSLLLILISVFFMSCDNNRYYEKNKEISDGLWNNKEIIRFEVPLTDTTNLYNFIINIRTKTTYPYSNLFLFMNTVYPDRKASRDTMEILLANSKGKWLGEGSGEIKLNRIMLKKRMRFPQTGLYSFEFQQSMRVDVLDGIIDFGIRIEKTE